MQIADITVYDGESTPVPHLFVAERVEYSAGAIKALWSTKVVGIPEYAQRRLTLTSRQTSGGIRRIGFRVDLPVMETPGSGTTVGYIAPAKVAYTDSNEDVQWVHPRSLHQGRLNAKMIIRNLLGNSSGTQGPVVLGVVHEALVNLIFPT